MRSEVTPIDIGKLEKLLSSDGKRLFSRIKEVFETEDFELPCGDRIANYSVGKLLESIAGLAEHQDGIFELLAQGKEVKGGFRPFGPQSMVLYAPHLIDLAKDRAAVIELFREIADVGYSDNEWENRTTSGAMLRASGTIREMAQRPKAIRSTIETLQKELDLTPSLYTTDTNPAIFYSNNGIFWQPRGFSAITNNTAAFVKAVKELKGTIDRRDPMYPTHREDVQESRWEEALYNNAEHLVVCGNNVELIANYFNATHGSPQTRFFASIGSVIAGIAADSSAMDLLRRLREYRAEDHRAKGIVMNPIHTYSHEKAREEERADNFRKLAANHGDGIVMLAKGLVEANVHMSMATLTADYNAGALLAQHAQGIGEMMTVLKSSTVHELKPKDYNEKPAEFAQRVAHGTEARQPMIDLAGELEARNIGLHGHVDSYVDAAPRIKHAIAGGINVEALVENTRRSHYSSIYVGDLPRAIEQSRIQVQTAEPQHPAQEIGNGYISRAVTAIKKIL